MSRSIVRSLAPGLLSAAALALACAHQRPRLATAADLKTAAESFHRLVRWGDLRGVAQMVVPDRRSEFMEQVVRSRDDENLKVVEYELEDAQVNEGRAVVLSKVVWHRLPSVTARPDPVTTRWIDTDGVWFVESIEGGPVPLAPRADGGADPAPARP